MAVLRPLRLVIENYPEGQVEEFEAINNPEDPAAGTRTIPFGRELYIEQDDFRETPPPKYFRLAPGAEVRLRYAFIVRCTGFEKDADGNVTVVRCTYDPATKSGTPGAEARKVKGNIHWLAVDDAVPAEVRLYDRLFGVPFPGARLPHGARDVSEPAPTHAIAVAGDEDAEDGAERDYLDDLNPDSKRVIRAYVEPALATAPPESRFQFERHGYFVADLADHAAGRPVYNRAVPLKDPWGRAGG
jgi:glutaminyl-tRNA synthetase